MTLELGKIPPKFHEKAIALEKRLADFETGLYSSYANMAGGVQMGASTILGDVGVIVDSVPDQMRTCYEYLEAVYEELGDFSTVVLNEDTACFFVCRDLYPHLAEAFEAFERQVEQEGYIYRAVKELDHWGTALLEIGRPSYTKIKNEVWAPLLEIPGCDREIVLKVPKKLQHKYGNGSN